MRIVSLVPHATELLFALGLGVHLKSIVKSGGCSLVLALLSTLIILVIAVVGALLYRPL